MERVSDYGYFEFALQMEKDGAKFIGYCPKQHDPVRAVLEILAEEEDKHYQAILAIQKPSII